jgi:hypothetical protein
MAGELELWLEDAREELMRAVDLIESQGATLTIGVDLWTVTIIASERAQCCHIP